MGKPQGDSGPSAASEAVPGLGISEARFLSILKGIGGVALLVLAAYAPAMRGDFLSDDDDWVRQNPALADPAGLGRIWFGTESDQYQPLVYTSFWIERRLWGINPAGYHVVNVLLHLGGSLALWALLHRVGVRGALIAAILFALHPVNVESVAWIYERKNCLSGLFFFLTLLVLFKFDASGRPHWYVAALGLFVAALLSKASTVVLPAIWLLYEWWRGTLWRPRTFMRMAPYLALALAMSVLTVWYERQHTGAQGVEFAAGVAERFARSGWIFGFHLGKVLIPYPLVFMYPAMTVDPAKWTSYVPTVATILILGWVWLQRRGWGRTTIFGLGYYVIAMAPVLGFFDIFYHRYTLVADHFQYLAVPGIVALLVHGVAWALRSRNAATAAVSLAVIAAAWALSFQRSKIYRDATALWDDTLRRNPQCWVAHYELGEHELRRESPTTDGLRAASDHLAEAVRINPRFASGLINLGTSLNMLGRAEEAMPWFRRAVDVEPDNQTARLALGQACLARNDYACAVDAFRHLVRLRPDDAGAFYLLADACCRAGGLEQGRAALAEATRLNPAEAQYAVALQRLDDELRRRAATSQPAGP